jgi:hypothetical protein
MMGVGKTMGKRGKNVGFLFLYLLYGIIGTGILLFLLSWGSDWFYARDIWVIGAALRIGEWVITLGAVIMFIIWIVMLFRVIFGLEKDLET